MEEGFGKGFEVGGLFGVEVKEEEDLVVGEPCGGKLGVGFDENARSEGRALFEVIEDEAATSFGGEVGKEALLGVKVFDQIPFALCQQLDEELAVYVHARFCKESGDGATLGGVGKRFDEGGIRKGARPFDELIDSV